MPKSRDNFKARIKRRKREAERLRRKDEERSANSWLCWCGNWIDDGLHCRICGAEPPWGCPCDAHDEPDRDEFDYFDEEEFVYGMEEALTE